MTTESKFLQFAIKSTHGNKIEAPEAEALSSLCKIELFSYHWDASKYGSNEIGET